MKMHWRWIALLAAGVLAAVTVATVASPPVFTDDVTDFGRNRWRNHYTPSEPEYPLGNEYWEVPLGLSRSQPLVIQRDFDRDGTPEIRIYHIAGDRLWALNGDMRPDARLPGQSAEAYRQDLIKQGFILWSTPAEGLCATSGLTARDELLAMRCARVSARAEQRPFASSQAAYHKGARPQDDVIYVGYGHPAAVVALRASDGKMLGGFVVDHKGDRGIVGAPLAFDGDVVVVGTTSGEAYIVKGLTTGTPSARGLSIGGRISSSPMPLGPTGFIMASDARVAPSVGTHGYMMAYALGLGSMREFTPRWPAAVQTPSGIPGEAAIDDRTIYFADKHGKLYALRLDTGELLWCRQFPGLGPCTGGGNAAPAFINNGPGVDEDRVYFVIRNREGPNVGAGQVVALNKTTGQPVWQQAMTARGNTAPVPTADLLLVGDTAGQVQAYNKRTGAVVKIGGYPLELVSEGAAYQPGMQGERWWEPVAGTATQMTVAAGLLLMGVNSTAEETTVLKAYRLHRLPDLTLRFLDVPGTASADGFTARVMAVCNSCPTTIDTAVSLKINGLELPRQRVTFAKENGWAVTLRWDSGPVPAGAGVTVVATVDPANEVAEVNETNNTLRAEVFIPLPEDGDGDRWGSKLTD